MTHPDHHPSFFHDLESDAKQIRRSFLRMHFQAKAGHIGCGLSAIDLLTYLYKSWLAPGDKFILSKGHSASALYATLHHFRRLPTEAFATYYQDGTLLPAHPAARAFDEIPAATGALGHGLPIAAGMAFANKRVHKVASRVACLLSDGECNEGSTWEAALFAGHHDLSALTVLVDANGLQGFGRTADVLDMEPFVDKWTSFGFRVLEISGHDFEQIHRAMASPPSDGPTCIVARTNKGRGVRLMEDKMEWHYLPMSEEQYLQALADVDSETSPPRGRP